MNQKLGLAVLCTVLFLVNIVVAVSRGDSTGYLISLLWLCGAIKYFVDFRRKS